MPHLIVKNPLTHDVEVKNVNFALLKKQKKELTTLLADGRLSPDQQNALEGVLNLVDAMQDYAVDTLGLNESEVFDLEQE